MLFRGEHDRPEKYIRRASLATIAGPGRYNSKEVFIMRLACVVLSAVLSVSGAATAQNTAQSYPTKPIRFVIPFPPGGPADIFGRTIGQQLSDRWNQQVVIDNRAGAGGNIGADIVAKAPPDGYTILMGFVGTHAINPSLYKTMPYDNVKDFEPVG